jgi:hypothetical protein
MKSILIILLALCAATAWSAVPQLINYQGFLTGTDGTPLDTTVFITFKIYLQESGGFPLWAETQPAVTVTGGIFHVLLGSYVALGDIFAGDRWLEVKVGTDLEMTPRARIVSVPYAYRVGTVDGASGGTVSGDVVVAGKANIGSGNTNAGTYASVFGQGNTASGPFSAIGGGSDHVAGGSYACVSGGQNNRARGDYSVVAGGSATAADSNSASGNSSVIGGGYHNAASGYAATIGGGYYHTSSGNSATVSGGYHNTATNFYATVAGGTYNAALGQYATVSGGAYNTATAPAQYATVSGGRNVSATSQYATVSGGYSNWAGGEYSTVSGGSRNLASGSYSVISGGGGPSGIDSNWADGDYSMIPGGRACWAAGDYSFAAGRRAKAYWDGCFRWADDTNADFYGGAGDTMNSFSARATGGVFFYTNTALSAGAYLWPGASAWSAVSDSTKKRNIRLVDTKSVLDKVAALPIKQWSYKAQDPSVEHIGPMAQDFWNLFHLGEDSLGISTIDPDGIALAAIQELAKRLEAVEAENLALRAQVQTMMASKQENSALVRDR